MSVEARKNNSFALVCNRQGCHMEVLGESEDDVREDANLMGWRFSSDGTEHSCKDCSSGRNPAAVAEIGTDKAMIDAAPIAYRKGEAVHSPDGEVVGYADHDAEAGKPLEVSLVVPGQDAMPVQMIDDKSDEGEVVFDAQEDELVEPAEQHPVREDGLDPGVMAALDGAIDEDGIEDGDLVDDKVIPMQSDDKPHRLSQPHGDTVPGVTATSASLEKRKKEIADDHATDDAKQEGTQSLIKEVDDMFSSTTWDPNASKQ